MKRFKIFLIVSLIVLFSLSSSFAGIEDSKFVLDQLLEGKDNPDVALLVIDMQKGLDRNIIDPDKLSYISNLQDELIVYASKKGIPVINVVIPYENRASEFPISEMMVEIKHKTYYKLSNDAFNSLGDNSRPGRLDTLYRRRLSRIAEDRSEIISGELGDYLKSEGIKNVFLTGCFDSVCIVDTAKGALSKNFKVYSDRDLNLVTRAVEKNKKKFTLSEKEYKMFSDSKWEDLKKNFPDTLEVFSSENSQLRRSKLKRKSECLD